MEMGEIIRSLRKEAGLTQEELGLKIGLKKSAIAKYENGKVKNIKRSTIKEMANLFNVSPIYIMGLSNNKYAGLQSTEDNLSDFNIRLLKYADGLTKIGQKKVLDYAKDLSTNPQYNKSISEHIIVNAAHERNDIEITDEMRAHDDAFFNED